ncbi:MAG: cytochrome b N-terminal domain-containing protein [Nitrospinae bacterium]|nr:cytochrome b N-terminal domain-containing protein [Nitrospinota bacterium]
MSNPDGGNPVGRWSWRDLLPKKIHYRHYFGAAALILFILQFVTGLFMIFYYEPSLAETYKTVQYFDNEVPLGALTRNLHRYGSFLLVLAAMIHLGQGYFRRDYQGRRKVVWTTGILLFMVMIAFEISGSILPWEWKGYWIMEMFNNWLRLFPVVGETLYAFFMTSYTPTRNFVVHDIVLPLGAYVLLQWHCLANMKKRGLWANLLHQAVATVPLLTAALVMSLLWPVPTEDPQTIPFPMDGVYIPAPEWYFVTFLMPIWYYPPRLWALFLFWIPALLFAALFALPFLNRRLTKQERTARSARTLKWMGIGYLFTGGLVGAALLGGLVVGSVDSPWMGCNSCHNTSMGERMGIPPVTYKDQERNPLLLDSRWMLRHWYQPQVVW